MALVEGDDEGQDAAVNDELHGQHLVVRVQVGLNQRFKNQFVFNIFCGKLA